MKKKTLDKLHVCACRPPLWFSQ